VIDRWVLSTTLAWIEDARVADQHPLRLHEPVGRLAERRALRAGHAGDPGAPPYVAERLCMEITESVALHDLDNTRRFIDQVRASA
jgi:EAL domain-containing protein (putative c-di-GMP-specific phosphodiesterase class I)